jgi:HSP20 family protein
MQERSSGAFSRTITLPGVFDPDKVMSESADGELTITLPKAPETRARRVQVKPAHMVEGSTAGSS